MIKLDGATLLFPTSFGYFDPHMLQDGGEVSRTSSSAIAAACGPRASTRRTPAATSATSTSASISPASSPAIPRKIEEARLRRRQADPAGAAQHQRLHAGRALASIPTITTPGDLHRRLVDAGQGGRGHQQPDRPGRRRRHLPRRQPQGGGRDRRARAASTSAATTPTRPTLAPKGYLTGAEWNWAKVYKTSSTSCRPASRCRNFVRGGLKEGFVKMSPYGPAVSDEAQDTAPTRSRPRCMKGGFVDLQGPAQGQHGQGRHRRPAPRSCRPIRARSDELPRRRRDRRDRVRPRSCRTRGPRQATSFRTAPVTLGARGGSRSRSALLLVRCCSCRIVGASPLAVLRADMCEGAFGSWFSWQNTLARAAPLMLTALCIALPARLGLVIIGGEGALVLGGLARRGSRRCRSGLAAAVVAAAAMASPACRPAALWIALAGVLRQRRGVNETISSLLLDLHRHRAVQPPGRRAAARPGEPQQAVDHAASATRTCSAPSPAWTSTGAWSFGVVACVAAATCCLRCTTFGFAHARGRRQPRARRSCGPAGRRG